MMMESLLLLFLSGFYFSEMNQSVFETGVPFLSSCVMKFV